MIPSLLADMQMPEGTPCKVLVYDASGDVKIGEVPGKIGPDGDCVGDFSTYACPPGTGISKLSNGQTRCMSGADGAGSAPDGARSSLLGEVTAPRVALGALVALAAGVTVYALVKE